MGRSRPKTKPVSLALQGGGSHGTFTWGVLDRLSECEELDIQAITATSAGAMNAVAYLSGLATGGKEGGRETLEAFWKEVSRRGAPLDALKPAGLTADMLSSPFMAWHPHNFATAMTAFLSPYDFNPFDINPLKETLESVVDFEAVRKSPVELFVSATNVETGKVKIFSGDEISVDSVMASACLPHTFKAVEIDGVPYWDGGYMGNPSLFPLFYSKAPRDVLLVMLNPLERKGTPRSAGAIQDRLNEITFNASLLGELRSISFVQKLLSKNWLTKTVQSQYKKLNVHAIRGGEMLREYSLDTKFDTRWSFLQELRDHGRSYAVEWLDSCLDKVGKQSSLDIHETFLEH